MDFFDVFMKLEDGDNQAATTIFGQTFPEILEGNKHYTLYVVDDFIDLLEISKDDLKFVLSYSSLLERGGKIGKLNPTQIISFLKFYIALFNDYVAAAENMNKIFGVHILEIPITELLVNNYLDSLDIYDNFEDKKDITEYENINLDKKLVLSYEDMIIIIYTKIGKIFF